MPTERKIDHASRFVRDHIFVPLLSTLRFNEDFLGFYVLGFGACHEISFIEHDMLNRVGVESRIVSLVGEDHEFIEVKTNNTWMASDPGYSLHLVSREDRAEKRLREWGAISLVCLEGSNPPCFITDEYVSTDTIVVQVLKEGLPYVNGSIELKHLFLGNYHGIGGIPLDNNGTIVLELGDMQGYNSRSKAESWYWVFVDGRNTNQKITSHGKNGIRAYTIDLE